MIALTSKSHILLARERADFRRGIDGFQALYRARLQQEQIRTGVYSSGLIAELENGQKIILYQTNIGHAGEWMDEILEK
ncbi:MAG: hypothetical protein CSA50_07745 [Gammaproteobacteria bacterium]|nr:MAG: hypothetical protein CSA50_07745 [Gammaproteobacteria bacterium]